MLGALKMLGEDELQDMIEKDNGAEATCHFCNEVYHTSSDHLARLINELRQDRQEANR
jgi:molecular chaperone Hsp33